MLSLVLTLAVGAPSSVLSATPSRPLEFLHVAPTGQPGRISRSDVLRTIEAGLKAHTVLRPNVVDPIVNEDCRGQLACIVRVVSEGGRGDPRWLLLLTQISLSGELDRVRLTLLDLRLAREVLQDPFGGEPEVALARAEHRAEPRPVAGPDELAALFDEALLGPLSAPLGAAQALRPTGSLTLKGGEAGAVVRIDGSMVGVSGDGELLVDRVPLGPHEVELDYPGAGVWSSSFELSPDRPRVELRAERPAPELGPASTRAWFVAGGGVLAAGGAALLVAAAVTTESVSTACFEGAANCRPGSSFAGFGYDPSATDPRAVDPSGPGMAAVGLALATAGTGLAVGALFEDGEDVPWWSVGLSALAGGAAFGVAVALDSAGVD